MFNDTEPTEICTYRHPLSLHDALPISTSIGHELTYDRHDDKIAPGHGYLLRLSQELAGVGGTERYIKNVGAGYKYFTLSDDVILTLGAEAGSIIGLGEDVRLPNRRSEEHTSELQSLMRISYAVFCLKKKKEH